MKYYKTPKIFLTLIFVLFYTNIIAQTQEKSILIEGKKMVITENEYYHPEEGFIQLKEGEPLIAEMTVSPEKRIFGLVSEKDKAEVRKKLDEYIKKYQTVLYPENKERTVQNRSVLSGKILIHTNLSKDALQDVIKLFNVKDFLTKQENYYFITVPSFGVIDVIRKLRKHEDIISAEPILENPEINKKSIWIEDRGSRKEMVIAENEYYHKEKGIESNIMDGQAIWYPMEGKMTIHNVISTEVSFMIVEHKEVNLPEENILDYSNITNDLDNWDKIKDELKKYQPILYPKGAKKDEMNRRYLTNKILIQTSLSQEAITEIADVKFLAMPVKLENHYLLETKYPILTLSVVEKLRENKDITSAEPFLAWQASTKDIPNDPLFSNQWHLQNTGQSGGTVGIDANVVDVWGSPFGSGITGNGIRIAIVDDGLQTNHPDLAGNTDTTTDYDFNNDDNDPTPSSSHGTSCGGVAAGVGNNGVGITGAAPEAELVGLRLIAGPADDLLESQALSHHITGASLIHISSNSWGPFDDGQRKVAPGTLTKAVLEQGATTGRNGLGTIYTWAGGNGLNNDDNSNYDGYANSIYTISVGAITNTGVQTWYSESGANLIVGAPSDGGTMGITTTRNGSNYTNSFGGTSSACPLVSGVVALVLEANSNLGWRDVQEILLHSATKVDASDSDWIVNAAGLDFNHKYGGGMINAQEAVNLAQTWSDNLSTQISETITDNSINQSIPDNDNTGITYTFDMSDITDFRVEHVELTVDITHTYRGDLQITLTSPEGTSSTLAEVHGDANNNYSNWTFMTARSWGENARGTWTLNISDRANGDDGTLNAANIKLYGSRRVTTLSPAHNSVDVGLNSDLVITFAQNVSKGTGNIYLRNQTDNTILETININDSRVGITDNQLTITGMSLLQNTEYYVNIDPSAILDLAGKDIKAFDNTDDWNFETVDLATNLEELTENGFKIYPNPVEDILQIESLNDKLQNQNFSYTIYDMQGKVLQRGENVTFKKITKLNLVNLKAGFYIFNAEIGGKKVNYKFIKE